MLVYAINASAFPTNLFNEQLHDIRNAWVTRIERDRSNAWLASLHCRRHDGDFWFQFHNLRRALSSQVLSGGHNRIDWSHNHVRGGSPDSKEPLTA